MLANTRIVATAWIHNSPQVINANLMSLLDSTDEGFDIFVTFRYSG
ncbi:MAG: hypothetical protein ACYC27_20035 [Armatimonadota bacterium]